VVAAAQSAGRVAVDTEFFRERTYRAKLCLLQIATPDSLWLVDPLEAIDLTGLAGIVGDDRVEVVVHAGKQDFELLHDHYGVVPKNIFDVQIAAGFLGLGANLPYGRLVESLVGVKLQKGESYTDWCRRPLTPAQLDYAADDVRYLLEAAERLKERLRALERYEWAMEEMEAMQDPDAYGIDPDRAWERVGGRGTLSSRQTTVLKELARWREETAARRDVPRGWVVKDPTLIEIARRMPGSVGEIKSIRGLNAKEADRSGRHLIGAVEKGKAAPPMPSVQAPSRTAIARARMMSGLADAIVRARCEHAEIATELVSTRGELESLLAAAVAGTLEGSENRHRLLRGWRRDLAGDAVLDLAAGRLAVRAIEVPPYVEEVPL
jgi:ribonuclease D